jgi:4a-hydroxytetrahydrobiopterin dehydratase
MSLLDKHQLDNQLKELVGWEFNNNQIEKVYKFKDFIEAFSFVNVVALESEKMDHHPDILIFSWNKVKISISTHSEGGVTEKDFELARKIELRLSQKV